MTADQAGRVVAYLAAAFQVELSEETAAVWLSTLGADNFDIARAAATEIVHSHPKFPSPAHFRQVMRAEVARRAPDAPRELSGPLPAREHALARVADLRRVLDAARGPGR